MKTYDIFASEGGFRVALALWGENPIIAASPWYETLEAAKNRAAQEKERAKNQRAGL